MKLSKEWAIQKFKEQIKKGKSLILLVLNLSDEVDRNEYYEGEFSLKRLGEIRLAGEDTLEDTLKPMPNEKLNKDSSISLSNRYKRFISAKEKMDNEQH